MEQHTVRVRVQVIDVQPRILQTSVATYLPMDQLTQLIARESGLQAFWSNGVRRLYWLRARGRLLQSHETLAEVGVVGDELVYLLPQPPDGMAAFEQNPDYPDRHPYLGQGYFNLVLGLFGIVFWVLGWGIAIHYQPVWWVSLLPSFGFGVWNVHFSRHIWGGSPSKIRIIVTAMVFMLLSLSFGMFFVHILPIWDIEMETKAFMRQLLPGVITAMIAVLVTYMAWWGSVEPLRMGRKVIQQAVEEQPLPNCGICGAGVEPDVLVHSKNKCWSCSQRVFHTGCYSQVIRSYRGDPHFCPVCREKIG